MEHLDARDCCSHRFAYAWIDRAFSRIEFGRRDLERVGSAAVETEREFAQRRVAATAHVGDDRAHGFDADIVAQLRRSLQDAGALAFGDIGRHFPPSDDRWKGADSRAFVRHCHALIAERGWRVGNVDVTVICERPKVGPHADAMRACVAEDLRIGLDTVSIKATTTEKLGFTGRGEGIAAQAVVLLERA